MYMYLLFRFLFNRLKCKRCVQNIQTKPPPDDTDCTSHLSQWFHCSNNRGLPDSILAQAWTDSKCVSFVFHHRSQAQEIQTSEAEEKSGEPEKKPSSRKRPSTPLSDDSADEDFAGF